MHKLLPEQHPTITKFQLKSIEALPEQARKTVRDFLIFFKQNVPEGRDETSLPRRPYYICVKHQNLIFTKP